jgi:hypothetical protein
VVIDHHIARIYQHLGGSGLERKKKPRSFTIHMDFIGT